MVDILPSNDHLPSSSSSWAKVVGVVGIGGGALERKKKRDGLEYYDQLTIPIPPFLHKYGQNNTNKERR